MALRAVIFDYGKVLSALPDVDAHTSLVKATGLEDASFEDHYWAHRHDYDSGHLDSHSYWQTIAQEGGFVLTDDLLAELLEHDGRMWGSLNSEIVDWAGSLQRSGFKVGVLSNMGDGTRDHLLRQHAFLQNFDHLTWSCELKIAKPDPEIYHYTLNKLGVAPEEALFIDDIQRNIDAAKKLGINAILFTDADRLANDLKALGLDKQLPMPVIHSGDAT